MAPQDKQLDALRREIDQIDAAMHDLLMKRVALVGKVRGAKGPVAPLVYRPGREATVLRTLLARHHGPLPRGVVVRLWREIISALVRLQGPFSIAVYAPKDDRRYVELAQDHFSRLAVVQPFGLIGPMIGAVGEGRAQVAVVPLGEDAAVEPWWLLCGGAGPRALHVLARLPYWPASEGAVAAPVAAVVGRQQFEPTGEDRGFIAVETDREMSRTGVKARIEEGGLKVLAILGEAQEQEGRARRWVYLAETEPYVGADDPRLPGTRRGGGIIRVRLVGGYARAPSVSQAGAAAGAETATASPAPSARAPASGTRAAASRR